MGDTYCKKDCNRSEVNVVKIIQIGLHEMKTNVVWFVKFEKSFMLL